MKTIPQPPVEPALEDCCRSGCTPCIFDLYAEALERYEAWLAEQANNKPQEDPKGTRGA
jgi:hypothetical protein